VWFAVDTRPLLDGRHPRNPPPSPSSTGGHADPGAVARRAGSQSSQSAPRLSMVFVGRRLVETVIDSTRSPRVVQSSVPQPVGLEALSRYSQLDSRSVDRSPGALAGVIFICQRRRRRCSVP